VRLFNAEEAALRIIERISHPVGVESGTEYRMCRKDLQRNGPKLYAAGRNIGVAQTKSDPAKHRLAAAEIKD